VRLSGATRLPGRAGTTRLDSDSPLLTASAPTAAEASRQPSGAVTRICIVAPSLHILGGQAIQAQRLIAHLREIPSLEVGFLPHNPQMPAPLRWLQSIKYLRTVVTTVLYVALLLRHVRRYDIIHTFSAAYWSYLLGPLPAILVARMYGKTVILNYRSGELEDHLQRWRRVALPTMALAHEIIAPSPYLTEVFARFGLRARTIHNYLDPSRLIFRERTSLRPIILANRNLEELYNYPNVLRAFARIQRRIPSARLIIAGTGSQRDRLVSLIEALGVENVEMRGRVPPEEMPRLYDEADIYVNGTDIDAFPGSVIEAFASGIPVVTTDAGGIPFIVDHERNGLVVPCCDHEALAAGVLRLLDDPALAERLAARAREDVVSRYTWRAVGPEWQRIYLPRGGRPRVAFPPALGERRRAPERPVA
jgi:glycosyltransferase involved in cell wall biosynthesis